jgi:hypothetical protein
VPVQVGSPLTAGTLTASHAAFVALNSVQLPGKSAIAASSVALRAARWFHEDVFFSRPL